MRAAAFLEVFQDAAVELMDVAETLALHVWACLLAANAAGAKHHHRLVFERFGDFGDRFWEIAEMVDARREGAAKSAEFDFVVVACVEKRDLAALVKPLLERGGRELGRCSAGGADAFHTEGDDLLFDPHEHSREGLMPAQAEFRRQVLKAWDVAQCPKQNLDAIRRAGHEKVDAFGA